MRKRAQSLIEVLIALGVAVIVIVALVQSLVTSVKNSQFSKNQNVATRYSQDAIEKIRAERDSLGWAGFYAKYNSGDIYCIKGSTSADWVKKNTTCAVLTGTIFTRQASFTHSSSTKMTVVVTTSWTDSSGTHKSEQTTYLTEWQ